MSLDTQLGRAASRRNDIVLPSKPLTGFGHPFLRRKPLRGLVAFHGMMRGMEYDLAKQLKEAGFPQVAEWSRGYWDWPSRLEEVDGEGCFPDFKWNPDHAEKYKDNYIYFPTLSELVDECGKDFVGLIRHDDNSGWTAFKHGDSLWDKDRHSEGTTHLEAAARLWLALNAKN